MCDLMAGFHPEALAGPIETARAARDPVAEEAAWVDAITNIRNDVAMRLCDPLRIVASGGRGQLRRELALSPDRCAALLQRRDLEVTLQRTFAALNPGLRAWYNHFNLASGVCGSAPNRNVAMDLLSVTKTGRQDYWFDPIEVKVWGAESPDCAALQLIHYFCIFDALIGRRVRPYDSAGWTRIGRVRLWVMGPQDWFEGHWWPLPELITPDPFAAATRAFATVPPVFRALAAAEFQARPIILKLTAADFCDAFDQNLLSQCVQQRRGVPEPTHLLTPAGQVRLSECFTAALQSAGF